MLWSTDVDTHLPFLQVSGDLGWAGRIDSSGRFLGVTHTMAPHTLAAGPQLLTQPPLLCRPSLLPHPPFFGALTACSLRKGVQSAVIPAACMTVPVDIGSLVRSLPSS